jgi:hypothetical protein
MTDETEPPAADPIETLRSELEDAIAAMKRGDSDLSTVIERRFKDIIAAISGPAADVERVLTACSNWAHVEIRTPQVSPGSDRNSSIGWASSYSSDKPGWIVRVSQEPLPVMTDPAPVMPTPQFEIIQR